MITVFGGWPTRSQRVLWLLEEMGVPYQLHPVDLANRRADAALQAVNPAGFLPALQDGEVTMVESVAIMEYLMSQYGPTALAPPPADPAYPLYLQFLHLGEAGLAAYLNVAVASRFFAPKAERDNWGARVAGQLFMSRLGLVARRLESVPFLAGEAFTAADISVCYALELGERVGLAGSYPAVVGAYMQRLAARDAYQRALAQSPPRELFR